MTVTVSLVIVFGIILGFLLRFRAVGFGAAFVATAFGFYLASTGAADTINAFTLGVIETIADL